MGWGTLGISMCIALGAEEQDPVCVEVGSDGVTQRLHFMTKL